MNAHAVKAVATAGIVLASMLAMTGAKAAEQPGQIDLSRLDQVIVQVTEQDRRERPAAHEQLRLNADGFEGRQAHSRVTSDNLLNSDVARFLARNLTGN